MSAHGLNIVLIGPYPLQDGKIVGGVEAVTTTLATALSLEEAVAHVTVLRFHTGQVPVHRRPVNDKLQVWYLRGQARFKMLTRLFLEVRAARRALAELQPDIVHGQGIGHHGEIATQISDRAVVTVHGLPSAERRLRAGHSIKAVVRDQLINRMTRRVARQAQTVISISSYDSQAMAGLVRGRHVVIPNPISPEFFHVPRHESQRQRVLFAGVLARRKNVEGLLRAFALAHRSAPSARLTLVGPEPDPLYAREIRDQVRATGLSDVVDLVGHVDNARLVQEIRACDVVTLFSHEETSPTILAQAMAMRKPIVASHVGGIPEMVIEAENGFLVTPGDERAFAERLGVLLTSPELCREMGEMGHEIARQRFEPSAIARRTVEVYQDVGRAGPGR